MIKKSTKTFVFIIYLWCNFLLLKFIVCDYGVLGVAAINEQQRQEIERLKSELSAALNNENKNVAAKGVIVQPTWTQSSDKSNQTDSMKVKVNAQNRNEAAAIRQEIQQAVARDKYAKVDTAKIQDIKAFETFLGAKAKGKAAVLSTTQGKQSEPAAREEEHVGASSVDNDEENANLKGPNVITAHIGDDSDIDIRKLQRLEVSKRRTREVLVLQYIEEDFTFVFGADVNEWKHIVHAGQEYFIGRRVSDLLIVSKEAAKYERPTVVEVGHVITYIETYTYWNLELQQQEAIILIATEDKVLWYRANHETKQIELYWEWLVGNTITDLTYFALESKNYLSISSNRSLLSGHYALNIYQYKLETKEFWIVQRLQLEYPCEEVTFLNSGRDVILAIPQSNTAAIYTFNPHEAAFSHIHFELKMSIDAQGILTIAGFQMGGRSYLALTGYQPQILLYQQGEFVSKTILGSNFGLVELFFPIPVRTYRDDLILLVQHRVDFNTHNLTVVETLIWDGDAFETSMPVPCHLGKQVVYGVGCMLDLQRDAGLRGAALLKNGDNISIIVPRYKAESGLFRFHTKLLAKNSELLDLQEIFEFLKDWVKEEDDLIAQAETFLQIPNEELIKNQSQVTVFESLVTPEFVFNGDVEEIYVNDYKWTSEDSNIDLELLVQDIEELDRLINTGRQRRNLDDGLLNELDFDEVIVEELELKNLNGQPFFIQNGELIFDGLVHFSDLEVLEKLVNLRKRELKNEELILESDLEFSKINDVNWSDIRDNLVFRTEQLNLKELEVKGEVFVESLLNIDTLNTLNFPDDYLLSNGPATSIVKAEKHFNNTLSASAIDINGLINGKNPADAITLTDPQEWRGTPTFKHLEVAEVFELNGQIHARDENTFPQNPTLQETNMTEATCHFNELTVNGPVVLKGEMDGQRLGLRLKDILLKSQDPSMEILVPSLKTFASVTFPIDFHLQNNTINQIPISDFVTVHTNQTLNITSLEGYVYFHNLTLNGSYDGVKIEEILEEIIVLEKPIDLSSTEIIFPEELRASSISISDTINEQAIKNNLQTLQEDLNLKFGEFEHLQTQQADFSQDILGQGRLNDIELNERSWHERPISGNVFINELILEKGIQTDELHGVGAEFLLDFLNQIDELPDMVLNGQVQVDHITVTGDIQLNKLNGLLFEEDIKLKTIKLDRPNFSPQILSFKNRLNIQGKLNVVGNFKGNYLPDIMDDIVVRSTNSCIIIKAPKMFLNSVEVLQNTKVNALNGIPMQNVAWKTTENNFVGSLHLKGNLVVHEVNLQGNINNFNWQDLESLLYFDENLQNFVLKNTIEFTNPLFLEDFTVMGHLNDLANISDFLANLIYKNQQCLLKGKNVFTGRVSIDNGAHIEILNGQDLTYFLNNLVLIQGPEAVVIETPVTFEDSIIANEIQVKQSLNVENINGCSIREWLKNSLRVDQDQNIPHFLKFAAGSIDGNSLAVDFINDKNLSRVITLNTPQTFNERVKIAKVVLSGSIVCKGWVNNLDLEEEFNNTLMTYGYQHISAPLNIQSIVVLGDLAVHGLVNKNKDLQDVATLHGDLTLESPIYFQSIYSPEVVTQDLVTGIDFDKWFDSAVKYQYPDTQYITGNWSTKYLKVTTGPQDFQYITTGFEPRQFNSFQRISRSDHKEAKEICWLLKQIWQDMSRKPVHIKYIEYFHTDLGEQFKNSNESLKKIFYLKSNQKHILLINLKSNKTFSYKWLTSENKFIFENSFESGPIEEIEILPAVSNRTNLEFITNLGATENINNSMKAVNKWKVDNDSIVLVDSLSLASNVSYKILGYNNSLWALDNETIAILDLDYKIKQKWQLPVAKNKTRYRFVPFREETGILLTNGEHLVLLSNRVENKLNKSLNNQQSQFIQTSYFEDLKDLIKSESLLKPNTSLTSSLLFSDFKQIIERILMNLSQRLNQQVNITQLSIPETDLFDEHLVPDFLEIMEELQKQNIYSPEVFNISFDNITLPDNPAKVLAARVVQMAWPVVLEIQDIDCYLRTITNLNHPICSGITKSLGFLIKDVLQLANEGHSSKDSTDHTLTLTSIIERIRSFDKELETFVYTLENHKDPPSPEVNSFTNREFKILPQQQNDFLYLENSHLPGYQKGEILSLLVGSTTTRRHLWAVTNTNNNPGIRLHLEGLQGHLYQVISAIEPRSLQQLRIKLTTFLLYIENCCQVQIFRYRGSQGFEKYSEINSKEFIKQILTITLPSHQGYLKHFLILLFEKNIEFYEFVIEGSDYSPVFPWDCK